MELKTFLDRLFEKYHSVDLLWSDPLEFVHRFSDPWDQEAVALFSALLAYGNVRQIRRSVEALLSRMIQAQGSPSGFVRSAALSGGPELRGDLAGFVHRFNGGDDLWILAVLLGKSWEKYGSLGAHFLTYLDPSAQDFSAALNSLIGDWRKEVERDPGLQEVYRKSPSFAYLLTSPDDGSCCKRWCMFLRWMGRRDELDRGLWCEGSPLSSTFPAEWGLRPAQLVIPLDTHTGRISQYLGLTERKSLNWLAALEVTDSLRRCDPEDPTRYDFALARLGILDVCQRKYREEVCRQCDLVSVCRFARAGRKRQNRRKKKTLSLARPSVR